MASTVWTRVLLLLSLSVQYAAAANFPWEAVQLTARDVADFPAVRFGNDYLAGTSPLAYTECRAFPGTPAWPSAAEWTRLNFTLDGALLQPKPAGAVCYKGPDYNARTCQYVSRIATFTHYWLDTPLDVLTQWPEGNTCLASARRVADNCTQGGYPEYVVNATTVKHVQAAVNFARNKGLRLVIKNTGHDFGGRSVGAGALSVWVHNLKSFEFLPQYRIGSGNNGYSGMAVRFGAGLESWELFNYMGAHNISVAAPGGSTVGTLGGWFAMGGHGSVTSYLGLGSDQALSIEVVAADGRLVTADPYQNTDLFFALRGGGPSTYGVMTSVVMKAFPPINVTSSSVNINFSPEGSGPSRSPFGFGGPPPPLPGNGTNPFGLPNGTHPFGPFGFPNGTSSFFPNSTSFNASAPFPAFGFPQPGTASSADMFWKAVGIYYRFGQKVLDVGGMCYGYIYPTGNGSFSFTSSQFMVNMAPERAQALMQPLFDELANATGIRLSNPRSRFSSIYGSGHREGGGDGPVQTRYRSRLFPRANWKDDALFAKTMAAIRASIEAGYTFHGIMHAPTYKTAGWPGRTSAVNPAWRNALLHASLMETQPVGLTAAKAIERDAAARKQLDTWRAVTPGSGAYMNEGDPTEPNWQQSFYGNLYPQLLAIKHRRDPWGLFWAPTTPGSEAWEVRTEDGYPGSQNGRLCRVGAPAYGGGGGDGDGDDTGGDDDGDDGDDGDDDQ
ncbi:hypothetical protein SCUCBS95973_002236 [Sporothrix curviconia]|uniref:FAD-binding PCMH-type domain-containing protein n=1 Tax=Sporothrix curviconia TaxID=1260050 RepID=A0ABP0B582_9PEZI